MWYQIPRDVLKTKVWTMGLGGGLVVFVVDRNRLEVLGFKYLVAIQAANVVDPIASRHNLGPRVLAGLHKWRLSLF